MLGGYDWDFRPFAEYTSAFIRATGITIALSLISSVVGTLLGFPLGLLLRIPLLGKGILLLNDAVRAIPMLVLMFFFYYFPYDKILGIPPATEFLAATLALTAAQMVFTADLVRGAVKNVSREQVLAARALGLREHWVFIDIIMPDVIRQITPALVAFFIGNIKLSSLASVIGCRDVVFVARVGMGQTHRSLEAWIIVGCIYIVLVLPLALVARRVEESRWLRQRA